MLWRIGYSPSETPSRRAATGDARGAQSGPETGEHRDRGAGDERDDDRARLDDRTAVGEVGAEGLEQLIEPRRHADSEQQAERRAAEAEQQALRDDASDQLAARRAERAQQAELARALRDRDRERVEDDERADEEGDVGEDQEERPDEAELAFEIRGLVRGLLGRGAGREAARQDRLHARAQRGGGDAGGRGDVELVECVGLAGERAGDGQRRQHDARAAEVRALGELEDADERERLGAGLAGDAQRLTDTQVVALRGVLVDRDLAGGARKVPGHGRPALKARRGRRADERGSRGVQPLSAGVEDRREREDRARGVADARNRLDSREHGRGNRLRLHTRCGTERLIRGDDHRLVRVRDREDRAERLVDRVGEDVGPRHQGDAENDRDRGQRGPQLALREAAQHDAGHQPSDFIRSRIPA